MNKIFISIISHYHDELIINNSNLREIGKLENINLVIKNNSSRSSMLKSYCIEQGFGYASEPMGLGFGHNNNTVFQFCKNFGMQDNDWFLVVNPDVEISVHDFYLLQKELANESADLLTINLFKDSNFEKSEQSIRHFPSWLNALSMFVGKPVAPAYLKNELQDREQVEWASGAFLIFKAGLYKKLGGFDKKYFMYYEDVDICYRARKQFNTPVTYLKNVKAVHAGAYANRNIFSKHFRWYLSSLFKFLWSK